MQKLFHALDTINETVLYFTVHTSWGGTSKETVRRSTLQYVSTQGKMKNIPGPLAPPVLRRPKRNITALSYS